MSAAPPSLPRPGPRAVRAGRIDAAALYALVRRQRPLWVTAAFGVFLGRATLDAGVDPFLIAFAAASREAQGEAGAAACVGLLLGEVWAARPLVALSLVPVFGAVLLGFGAAESAPLRWRAFLGWATVVLLSIVPGLLARPGGPVAGWIAAADGLLGAVLFVVYRGAVPVLLERPAPRSLSPGPLWLLVGTALAGAFPLSFQGLPLADLLVPLCTLVAANLGGLEGGAVVGVVLGALDLSVGTGGLAYAVLAAAAGTLAGWARPLGRLIQATAYAAAACAFVAQLPSPAALVGALVGLTAALGLFLLMPDRLLEALGRWSRMRPVAAPNPTGSRLRELAQLFGVLSSAAGGGAGLPPGHPAVGFERRLQDGVARRACRGCPWRHRCWDSAFAHTYGALTRGMARLGSPDHQEELERDLATWCARPRDVAIALGYVRDTYELEASMASRWQESREVLSGQLRGLSELLSELEKEAAATSPGAPEWEGWMSAGPAGLGWSAGLARRPHRGVSGDCAVIRELPGGRLMVALSDGMGQGEPAAAESVPAVSLAERLLAAGFAQSVAVQTVNAMLMLGSRGRSFATLDLAVVDLTTGEAAFTKIGAVPTFLRRRGRVERLAGHAPPAGMMQRLEPDTRHRRLAESDWLVFMTDGAFDALTAGGDAWLTGFLKALDDARGPQWVADSLVAKAVETRGTVADDLTVVAVRLERAAHGAGQSHGADAGLRSHDAAWQEERAATRR